MTDIELRDLFHDAAAPPPAPDPAAIDRAWRDGTRRRVGVRTAVIASVAATAAIVTGVALVDPDSLNEAPSRPATSTSTPTSVTGPPLAERAGEYEGADIWWAPSAMDEASLPSLSVAQLPPVIDLDDADTGAVGEPVVALFAGPGQRALGLTASQRVVEIDTSRLEAVSDEEGNGRNPLSFYSLSADGHRAFFIQQSSLEVLDFETGEWTTIDTPEWLAEGARWVMSDRVWVPNSLGEDSAGTVYRLDGSAARADVDWVQGWVGPDDEPWGPVAAGRSSTARAAFLAGPVDGGTVANPQALMVERRGVRSVLALDYGDGGEGTRTKGCCVALGWLDRDTVLFTSTGSEGQRVLAWEVGTPNLHLVSDIRGKANLVALGDIP